jgi:molybdate transport system substrate-binding protein
VNLIATIVSLLSIVAHPARADELALNRVAEIVADTRLELVGPLPAPYQRYTSYAAGVIATSRSQDASRHFIAFMATPEAAAIMRRRGFEPN